MSGYSNQPQGLPFSKQPQRDSGLPLVDPYFSEDGPFELQKRTSANSTMVRGQNTIKWAQVTHNPGKSKDNRTWWEKLMGQTITTQTMVSARIFANSDGTADATHAMIAPSREENDNMCLLESRFEVPLGFKEDLKRGTIIQVDLYNTPEQPPLFKGLSGVQEADGRIIAVGDNSLTTTPGYNDTKYRHRGCGDDKPRPDRPNGGTRRSIVSQACAKSYKRVTRDLPTTLEGTFPMNPVTKKYATITLPLEISHSDMTDYGPRVHPINKTDSYHPGIDLNFTNTGVNMADNPPIYSVLDGHVLVQGRSSSWGNYVIVTHGSYYDLVGPKHTILCLRPP
mgnify:FL=1